MKLTADIYRTVEILRYENKMTGETSFEWMIPVISPDGYPSNLYTAIYNQNQ
jgi:hypothetical protein